MTTPHLLFVLKRREDYNQDPSYSAQGISTGLFNSASFVCDMLNQHGIRATIEVVTDNNDIDRVVSQHKPTHVIIEALWVVPEKFKILHRLHPRVKWIIRMHSETPFIANEGIAIEWLFDYLKYKNVYVGVNSPRFLEDIRKVLHAGGFTLSQVNHRVMYLPNYYPICDIELPRHNSSSIINVGCFGAVRPLKNHLTQAVAAIQFAESKHKILHFHINSGRTEMKGEPVMKNLKQLFSQMSVRGHRLVIHDWMPHDKFLDVIKHMDLGMQVSFSETFNIVAADMVSVGVPVIGSEEIPWLRVGTASPTDATNIANQLRKAWAFKCLNVLINTISLNHYSKMSQRIWIRTFLKSH